MSETLFISAVTLEYKAEREALRQAFSSPHRKVIQTESDGGYPETINVLAQGGLGFRKEGGTTIKMLYDFISHCGSVIHLVGHEPGAPVVETEVEHFHQFAPQFAKRVDKIVSSHDWAGLGITYTQLEAYFAHAFGKRLIVAVGPEPGPSTDSQRAHLGRLREQVVYPDINGFSDANDLELKLWRLHAGKRMFEQPERAPELRSMPKIYGSIMGGEAVIGSDSPRIFGRANERQLIDQAWHSKETKVLGFIAGGGVGKSTLVLDWLSSFRPEKRVSIFGFSFYLQGQTERQVDTDTFLQKVAEYFDITVDLKAAPYTKGKEIAIRVMRERCLIVLDGLEPLQEAATGNFRHERSTEGSFTDSGARGFLETLAQSGQDWEGLCILTSRIGVSDLEYLKSGNRYVEKRLGGLTSAEGAAFLTHLGVKGTQPQKEQISAELGGHALALLLTGTRIRDFHAGRIVDGTGPTPNLSGLFGTVLSRNDKQLTEGARHTFKALDNYVAWLQHDKLEVELDVLKILGLFDRSAEIEAIDAVRSFPPIPGLTEHASRIANLGAIYTRLSRAGLVARSDDDFNGAVDRIDAHPLIRQYFGDALRTINNGASFREGHRRLYNHYSQSVPRFPEKQGQMAGLYRTISHCCMAGDMQTAFEGLLYQRAWRSNSPDSGEHNFATRQLGMISADFVALTQFFLGELEDFQIHPSLSDKARFTILTDIAVRMRSLGRLGTAKTALRSALMGFSIEKMHLGYDGAYAAAQLSELELISGELEQAERTARQSVEYSDHQARTYLRFHARTSLADVLLQKGDLNAAGKLFSEAKAIADADPNTDPPFFYSQTCYRYGLYLVETGREQDLISLASKTAHWGDQRPHRKARDGSVRRAGSLLSSAIDQLVLSEAMVRRDQKAGKFETATANLIDGQRGSIAQLNSSGYSDYLARGLNVAARFYTARGDYGTATKHLEQNREHVRRGRMRLLEADYMIEACRLALADGRSKKEARKLHADATALCDEIGYGRRSAELVALAP